MTKAIKVRIECSSRAEAMAASRAGASYLTLSSPGLRWIGITSEGRFSYCGPYSCERFVFHPRDSISTSGGTGELPVCSAKWWEGRRDIALPVLICLTRMIRAAATSPAISMISI